MSFSWGAHNEAACDYLNQNGSWPDWVVTTAFYSAAQYIQGTIFPLLVDGATYRSYTEYLKSVMGGQRADKHELLGTLTFQHLHGAYNAYKYLKDQAKSARYKNHNVNPAVVTKARQYLGAIKAAAMAHTTQTSTPPTPTV